MKKYCHHVISILKYDKIRSYYNSRKEYVKVFFKIAKQIHLM